MLTILWYYKGLLYCVSIIFHQN